MNFNDKKREFNLERGRDGEQLKCIQINYNKCIEIQQQQKHEQQQIKMLQYKQQYRRSSDQKLPPIVKYVGKQLSKQKINRFDVSLELVNQMSKPKILIKAGSSKSNKNNISNHKASLRLRTDSMSANISSDKNSNREKDLKSEQYDSQKTLQDFHNNIKINKEYIHRQIKRRNQRAKNSNSSKENSKSLLEQNQMKSREERKQKRRVTEDSIIFDQIQGIISSKLPQSSRQPQKEKSKQKLNFNQVRNAVKMVKMSRSNRYINPEESKMKNSYEEETNNSSSRIALKDENNYHEWRRVDLNSNQKSPKYQLTNFETQNQRLKQYVLKNQISLSNYFEFKNELSLYNKLKTSS